VRCRLTHPSQKRHDSPFLLILDFSPMSLRFPAVHPVNPVETKNAFPGISTRKGVCNPLTHPLAKEDLTI